MYLKIIIPDIRLIPLDHLTCLSNSVDCQNKVLNKALLYWHHPTYLINFWQIKLGWKKHQNSLNWVLFEKWLNKSIQHSMESGVIFAESIKELKADLPTLSQIKTHNFHINLVLWGYYHKKCPKTDQTWILLQGNNIGGLKWRQKYWKSKLLSLVNTSKSLQF